MSPKGIYVRKPKLPLQIKEESNSITPRQQQMIDMIRVGKSNKEIAHELGIAFATVRNHIHAAFGKLNIQTRTQVMQIDVESAGKLLLETSLILADLVARCKELDACLRDPAANGYDGATTRAQWRQSIERAEAFLRDGGPRILDGRPARPESETGLH